MGTLHPDLRAAYEAGILDGMVGSMNGGDCPHDRGSAPDLYAFWHTGFLVGRAVSSEDKERPSSSRGEA